MKLVRFPPIVAAGLVLLCAPSVQALNGGTPLQVVGQNDWMVTELYSFNDDISGIADAGYQQRGAFDGLGGYALNDDSVRIFMNHELTNTAAITYLDIHSSSLQVTRIGTAYDTIYDRDGNDVTPPNILDFYFDRFCSASLYEANTWGGGRGFADRLYLTGEETSRGNFYVLDPVTRDIWEAADLGLGSWENAALIDTVESDHTALLLMDDRGSEIAPIRMYVGRKNPQGDFLDRNGLRGGTVYYWQRNDAASTDRASTFFVNGSGQSATGIWTTSLTGSNMRFEKMEDAHANPNEPHVVAFASQNISYPTGALGAVFTLDTNLVFGDSGLDIQNSSASLTMLVQENDDLGAAFGNPDNLTWSADHTLIIQEDGDGNEVWHYDPSGGALLEIADSSSGETSGVIDVSVLFGYEPGGLYLATVQGRDQLFFLRNPDAVPEPNGLTTLIFGLLLLCRRRVLNAERDSET